MRQSDEERFEARVPRREMRTTSAIGLIGGSSYIGLLVGIVRSILVMGMIGPWGRGVQRLPGLWKGYLTNVSMPWRTGVSKELPLAVGAEDHERAAEIEDAGFFATVAFSGVASLGMVLYAMFLSAASWEERVAFAVGGGLLLADDVIALYWATLRSWGRFHVLALGELVRTFAQLGLMLAGAWLAGVTGVMLGWLASSLLVLGYLDVASRLAVRTGVRWPVVWRLLRIGLPVAAISFADVLLRTVDGLVLEHYYGVEQFGLYTLAMQMATYLFALPRSAGFVIWPKVLQSYGGDDADQKHRRVLLPTVGIAAAMPVIAGMAWLALPMLVALVVPKWLPSVPAAQVLSMGAVFLALPLATDAALVANDREPLVITTKLIGAAVAGGGTWYTVTHAGSLTSVATWACVGFTVAALLSLWIKLREFRPRPARRLAEVGLALTPTAWVIACIHLVQWLLRLMGLSIQGVGGAIVGLMLFAVLSFPCLLYAHRRTGIGTDIRAIIRRRLGHRHRRDL